MNRVLQGMVVAGMLFATGSAWGWVPIDTCGSDYTHWASTTTWQTTRSGTSAYYSGLSDTAVFDALYDGFQVWSDASCCSDFSHAYGGDTSFGYSAYDSVNAIEFIESGWPSWFGGVNSTIAVTLPQYSGSTCVISNGDQAYNGVGFNFTTTSSPGWNDTDLQSIAAHEHGHWLGLDHSATLSATMYASYSGGIGARTLDGDDESGVCAIYPGVCGPVCPSALSIGCDQVVAGDNGVFGNTVQTWGCAGWDTTGPESVYSFTSSLTGDVTVRLTGLADDLDLFVTDDLGGSCDTGSCVASGTAGTADEEVTFPAVSGTTYQIVADGWDGASSSFSLEVDCGGVAAGTGTGTGAPIGVCPATGVLTCGAVEPGGNAGGSVDVDQFSCATWPTTGPEEVWELTPTSDGDVAVRLTGLTDDVDLFVTTELSGGCDANGCLGASQNYYLDDEEVVFTGQSGVTYTVVIDGYDGAVAGYDVNVDCTPSLGTGGTGTGSTGTGSTGSTGTGAGTGGSGTGGPGTTDGTGTETGTGTGAATGDEVPPLAAPGKGCACSSTTGGTAPWLAFLPLLALLRGGRVHRGRG